MARPADFDERKATLLARGLPCRLWCRRDDYVRIDLEPLPGWVHLTDDATVEEYARNGWYYHVSLSKWTLDEAVRDSGGSHCIALPYFSSSLVFPTPYLRKLRLGNVFVLGGTAWRRSWRSTA